MTSRRSLSLRLLLLLLLTASLSLWLIKPAVRAQTNCPQLEPILTGTNPFRSKNAWPQYAVITVNIVNNPPRNGISYSFTDAEVQGIKDVLNAWKDSPT